MLGYASLNYLDAGFRAAKLVKIDILINKEPVDALSFICEREATRTRATEVVGRLKDNIDRQQFEIVIQVRAVFFFSQSLPSQYVRSAVARAECSLCLVLLGCW